MEAGFRSRNIGVYEMTVVERPVIGKLRLEVWKTEVYSSVKVPERRVEDRTVHKNSRH